MRLIAGGLDALAGFAFALERADLNDPPAMGYGGASGLSLAAAGLCGCGARGDGSA